MRDSNDLPAGTILETDEELRKIRDSFLKKAQAVPGPQTIVESVVEEEVFRPSHRPPTLQLTIYDDGETTGETIRIRDDRFTIGRTEGDLKFPHDELISSRHISFTRQRVRGKHYWVVSDLQSRNGLFVRVVKAPLPHLGEFLVGSGRYQLECPGSPQGLTEADSANDPKQPPVTQVFGTRGMEGQETLTEILRSGIGSRYVLDRDEYWIGRDRDCDISRPKDLFLRGKHARLSRNARGVWIVHQNDTLNGVWIKIPHLSLAAGKGGEFQIGEQRFRVKVL